MATRKKAAESSSARTNNPEPDHTLRRAFEEALSEFTDALKLMHTGDFQAACERFRRITLERPDEPALAERARTFIRHCERKLAPKAAEPESADGLYYQAVLQSNNGDADGALRLLDLALALEPESPRLLYAKASAAAIKGDAESAVTNLRRAIAVDPKVRFQAGNDPDFETIREEPAFIDIIEPTPTGA